MSIKHNQWVDWLVADILAHAQVLVAALVLVVLVAALVRVVLVRYHNLSVRSYPIHRLHHHHHRHQTSQVKGLPIRRRVRWQFSTLQNHGLARSILDHEAFQRRTRLWMVLPWCLKDLLKLNINNYNKIYYTNHYDVRYSSSAARTYNRCSTWSTYSRASKLREFFLCQHWLVQCYLETADAELDHEPLRAPARSCLEPRRSRYETLFLE